MDTNNLKSIQDKVKNAYVIRYHPKYNPTKKEIEHFLDEMVSMVASEARIDLVKNIYNPYKTK